MTTTDRAGRRNDQQAAHALRPADEHDEDCTDPRWVIHQPIYPTQRVLAHCAGCTAVTARRVDGGRP